MPFNVTRIHFSNLHKILFSWTLQGALDRSNILGGDGFESGCWFKVKGLIEDGEFKDAVLEVLSELTLSFSKRITHFSYLASRVFLLEIFRRGPQYLLG